MMRSILILGSVLFLAAPSGAQESPPPAARYQILPNGDGFVRLDTETGALAHCGKQDSVWRCETLAEPLGDLDGRIGQLADEVFALTETVGQLAKRLDEIERHSIDEESALPRTEEQRDPKFDEALTFAERLMQRFFDFVRELKDEEEPRRI